MYLHIHIKRLNSLLNNRAVMIQVSYYMAKWIMVQRLETFHLWFLLLLVSLVYQAELITVTHMTDNTSLVVI